MLASLSSEVQSSKVKKVAIITPQDRIDKSVSAVEVAKILACLENKNFMETFQVAWKNGGKILSKSMRARMSNNSYQNCQNLSLVRERKLRVNYVKRLPIAVQKAILKMLHFS